MTNFRHDYRDKDGIQRRVLLPSEAVNPDEGIPVSLEVDQLYQHMPLEFRVKLVDELWAVGLVEPCDFLKPGAPEKTRAALLAVVKYDVLNIQTIAKENCTNAKRS